MKSDIAELVALRWSLAPGRVRDVRPPLAGGLESAVARVTVAAGSDAALPRRFIIKRLSGEACRESRVYRALWKHWPEPPRPSITRSRKTR